MEKFNKNLLRNARKASKLSLEDAGNKVHKDKSTIWRLENGLTKADIDIIISLCALYNISITDVIERSENYD